MQSNPIPLPSEYQIPLSMYQDNRNKFISLATGKLKDRIQNSILLLKGVATLPVHDQDIDYYVQQESNFLYLFNCGEPDSYGVLELDSGKSILFTPLYPESYKTWMHVNTLDEIKQVSGVSESLYIDNLEGYLANKKPSTVFLYNGIDSDSGLRPDIPKFDFLSKYNVDDTSIYTILNESRVCKTPQEIQVMRFICKISSISHERVIQQIRAGNKEYQVEAMFNYHCQVTCGARFNAYNCICASGRNAATLHYDVNDQVLNSDAFLLQDMGAKYKGYCADITVTFPLSGKFSEKQKVIYNAVLDAQRQVNKSMKPGINWGDMHLLAERTMMRHLHEAGLLVGDLDEINQLRIGVLFFPHGLGHLLGLRVHDVGGYNPETPDRSTEPGLNRLRTRRNLEEGMIITNEPGCYFIESILQKAFQDPIQSKYLNKELILQYMNVGGVRLEDDVLVTKTGIEILSEVPRSIEQVEACFRGENWRLIRN